MEALVQETLPPLNREEGRTPAIPGDACLPQTAGLMPPGPHSRYHTPFWLKNATLQSVLCSLSLRLPRQNAMDREARPMILDAGEGVRLLGLYSSRPEGGKGLVIQIHGWEGSDSSTYMLTTGLALFEAGYQIFRLNLRDHGPTHHLNEGIFRAFLLDEVHQAVCRAAELAQGWPVFLAGFSLGGNFVLRLLRLHRERPIPGLAGAVTICPLLDPERAAVFIDGHWLLRRYFISKWKRSLIKKQELFPRLYDFGPALCRETLEDMTREVLYSLGGFADTREYYQTYRIPEDGLAGVETPLTIIASKDDPVIDFRGFTRLKLPPAVRLIAPDHGGHGGFMEGVSLGNWAEKELVRQIKDWPLRASCAGPAGVF